MIMHIDVRWNIRKRRCLQVPQSTVKGVTEADAGVLLEWMVKAGLSCE